MRTSIYVAILLFFYCIGTLQAQDSKVFYPHSVFWSKIEVNEFFDPVESPWGWGADMVIRRKNEMNQGSMLDHPLRESFRPWINYQFTENSRLSFSPLGFMSTTEYVGKDEDRERRPYYELRSTLQFFFHQKQWGGRIMHTHRYRQELRWQANSFDSDADFRFLMRFRYRYRIRVMLNSDSFYDDNTVYAMASNEIGLNMGNNVVRNIFNQNRIYLGVGMRFLNAVRAEVRYVDRLRTRGSTGFEFDYGRGVMLCLYVDNLSSINFGGVPPSVRFSD